MSRHEITAVKDDDPMRKMSCIAIFAALVAAGCFPAFPERAKHADAATDEPLETNKDAATAKTSVDAKVEPGVVIDGSSSGHDVPTAVADAGSMEKGTGPAGKACTAGNMCESGTCVGGVCCDSVCAGKCLGCTKAATGSPDGVCAPVKSGTDPGSSCDESNKATCGLDGTCDGKGACAFWGSEVECGAESCTMGTYKAASRCDGTGACKAGATISCDKLPCEGTRCKGACTSNGDCPSAFYCDKGACLARKANGTQCAEGAECSSGQCVDKFCCQNDCKGACRSCAMAKTGKPNGTCDNALAGEDPHNDCEAAGTTCGLDGACDGKGACRKPGKETVCSDPSCLAGQLTPSRRCDGAGACDLAPAAASCNGLLCATATTCKTKCSTTADCVAGTYCSQDRCVAKKANGERCMAKDECTSSSCAGRCCAGSCNCLDKSADNLLVNPGFDQNLDGWKMSPSGTVAVAWAQVDAECPYSGSMRMSIVSNAGGGYVYQCVGLPSTTRIFRAGGYHKSTVKTNVFYGRCEVAFLDTLSECTSIKDPHSEIDFMKWAEIFSASKDTDATFFTEVTAPPAAAAAMFMCEFYEDGGPTGVAYFDRLFLNAGSGSF